MPASAWLAAGAVLAALAGPVVGPLPLLLATGALGSTAAALRVARRGKGRSSAAVRCTAALAVGVLVLSVRLAAGGTDRPTGPVLPPGGEGPWSATVVSVAAPREGRQLAILRLDPPAGIEVAGRLPRFPAVVPGDRLQTTGRLRPIPDDDYGRYLVRIGVSATLTASTLEPLPAPADPGRVLESLRRRSAEALAAALPEPQAGLASGILVGLRDRVDRDLAAAFTTAGISHVVAISGWNIAIVGATVGALAGRLTRRRRALAIAVAIVVYVAFVGASASVLRAAAMAGVALLARETGRPGRAATALAWAVVGLLLFDPALVGDAGFQLSALATAGLVAWSTPLAARLAGPRPGRIRQFLAESLGVSLAAQVATLPVVLVDFGRLSLVSPLVNLVVVPLVAPAMAAGAIALAAGWLVLLGGPPLIATLLGLPAWTLLAVMVGAGRAGAALPFASVELDPPWSALAGAGAALAIAAGVLLRRRFGSVAHGLAVRLASPDPRGRHSRSRSKGPPVARIIATALIGAIVAMGIVLVHRPDGVARVVILDVGQGDAILLEGGAGGRLLVDGGPDPDRLLVALDERLPPWDRRIDAIILSHPHEDHVAGLAGLIGRYRVGRVFEPGMTGPGPGYAAWRSALARLGRPVETLAAGDRLRVDGIRLSVLWPIRGQVPDLPADTGTGINNVSIALLGEVAGRRFLLAGDVERAVDPSLLVAGLPTLDLLKVAHHGSKTASTDAFLEAVGPRLAVVSAGADNPYGHPAPSTIARLEATGAQVFRTDEDGTVEVSLERERVDVRTSGPRVGVVQPIGATVGWAFTCAVPVPAMARLPSGG